MQIKIYTVPIMENEEQLRELNNFLATHRVVDVEQSCVGERYWTFCVRYVSSGVDARSNQGKGVVPVQRKVDYKEVLTEEEFECFSALRAIRKNLAVEEGIPAFAVFTDAELASFSKLNELSEASLTKVDGVGKQRVKNYGAKMLNIYFEQKNNETI